MIAYDELAAALERWRHRQGLPTSAPLFADGGSPRPPPPPAPAARTAQAIASAPPPPAATPAAQAGRAPPPPPSGRSTIMGMAAPVIAPPPAAPAAADGGVLEEADVLEESGDLATGFDGEPTRATGDAASSADGWPEARTVSTYGWGQAAPARTFEVDEADEATQIGDTTRHD
jgi:hypothetical protein